MGHRLTLLLISLAVLVLVGAGCGMVARYPREVHDVRARTAWVDARVAGAYVCESTSKLDELALAGGTVAEFQAWEDQEWGTILQDAEEMRAALFELIRYYDAGAPSYRRRAADDALGSARAAIMALIDALEARSVMIAPWVKQGGGP
jgi:hypothetical protein